MKYILIGLLNKGILFFQRMKPFLLRIVSRIVRFVIPVQQQHRLPQSLRHPWPIFKSGARRFIRPSVTIEQFFSALKERNIAYVVLRWFDDLPSIEEGEDIDLLVADEDFFAIENLFSDLDKSGQPVDIYSVSGLSGSSFRDIPYYPPHLAKEILDTRVWMSDSFAIPDEEHHFLSLAYHAVFHKGENSGIPNCELGANKGTPDHNYQLILRTLASKILEDPIDIEFNSLFRYLKLRRWTPELDTMRRLAVNDSWLSSLLPEDSNRPINEYGEVVLFVVREWAIKNKKLDFIKDEIQRAGLRILELFFFNEDQKRIATEKIRGGKWDKGPYPVGGGFPACFVVCFDSSPIAPSREEIKCHPFVKNKNVFLKHVIRDKINQNLLSIFTANFLHSADDEFEAWEYIQHVLPEEVERLQAEIALIRDGVYQSQPLLAGGSR
jgi:hypothetical protein